MGKGEIAHYEQFLLFPQCFQKACFPGASIVSLCGNGLKTVADGNSNLAQMMIYLFDRVNQLWALKQKNGGYKHFFLFPQCFQMPSLLGLLKVWIVWFKGGYLDCQSRTWQVILSLNASQSNGTWSSHLHNGATYKCKASWQMFEQFLRL